MLTFLNGGPLWKCPWKFTVPCKQGGLRRTSKILRNELAPFNIQVMVVEPGSFQTNFRVGGIVVSDQQSDLYRESYADAEVLR